jgi:hypothetical protein
MAPVTDPHPLKKDKEKTKELRIDQIRRILFTYFRALTYKETLGIIKSIIKVLPRASANVTGRKRKRKPFLDYPN